MQKRLLFIAFLFLAVFNKISAEDQITISDFSMYSGGTKEVSVMLTNADTYVGFQFDLYLPDGLTVESFSASSSRLPEGTTPQMAQQSDGSYRFIAAALSGNTITGSEGAVIAITVKANESVTANDYTGYLRNIKISKADGSGTTIAEQPFTITVHGAVATPTFTRNNNEVTITSATEGATIYYTMDGSTPTAQSSVYSSPITVSQNCTIKAYAVCQDYNDSEVATYNVNWFKVANVEFAQTGNQVALSTTTENAAIHYTLSTDPSGEKTYSAPLTMTGDCTIEAYATRAGYLNSDTTTFVFHAGGVTCSNPVIARQGTTNSVSITTVTEGATIHYTLDGSTPTAQSPVYSTPITVANNCTIKAIAMRESYYDSQVTTFVVDWFKVATPTFSWNNDELTISTTTEGATIYYSAQTADENGVYGADAFALYERPFEYKADAMLKAYASKEGMNNSDTIILDYPYTAWQELLKAIEYANVAIYQCENSPKINQQELNQFRAEMEQANIMYEERTASSDEIIRTADYLRVKANQFLDQLNAVDENIIQFADTKVKEICVANWDTDGDGELSKTEAASVTSLGGVFNRNKDITSFDEFQYFTGVKVIGREEFMDCNSLTSIILPSSIETIEREAFYYCRIQQITIPAGVTSISYAGLYGCFKNIYVEQANQYYTSVDGVLFNKDQTIIMYYPELRNEESYTIPSSVTVIGGCAFYSSSLSTIVIPNGVTRFETGAFRYCKQLKSIEIPETVELIESENFQYCNSLTSVYVPASVISMAGDVFSSCTSLKEIIVDQANPAYASVDGVLYNKDLTRLCIYPGGRPDEKFEIPEGVSTISSDAFLSVSNLQAVVIPKDVTQIGRFSYCSQLKSVTVYWAEPLSIGDNVFGDITLTEGTLYVPYGTKSRYEAANGWRQFQNIVEMDATIDYTFDSNGVLTVRGETTMADALSAAGGTEEVAKTITAVVWAKGTPLTNSDLQGLDNPNMLVYVADASLAPANRDNVVIGDDNTGYLAKNIMLTDVESGNNNFYCPQEFTAEMISYTCNFQQQTEVGVSRGWETIALPFQVQTIMHEKNGLIAPFGNAASDKHFWLRTIAADRTDGLSQATQIVANYPYLISMPNSEEYPAEYNQNGRVTFSSQNVKVPVTEPVNAHINIPNVGMVMITPTFSTQAANAHIYALNVLDQRGEHKEGSIFEANYRAVRPFEAYTFHENGQNPAPRYISISKMNSGTTGIENLTPSLSKGEGAWWAIDGRKLQQKPTQKGVYILNGRKTIIK